MVTKQYDLARWSIWTGKTYSLLALRHYIEEDLVKNLI